MAEQNERHLIRVENLSDDFILDSGVNKIKVDFTSITSLERVGITDLVFDNAEKVIRWTDFDGTAHTKDASDMLMDVHVTSVTVDDQNRLVLSQNEGQPFYIPLEKFTSRSAINTYSVEFTGDNSPNNPVKAVARLNPESFNVSGSEENVSLNVEKVTETIATSTKETLIGELNDRKDIVFKDSFVDNSIVEFDSDDTLLYPDLKSYRKLTASGNRHFTQSEIIAGENAFWSTAPHAFNRDEKVKFVYSGRGRIITEGYDFGRPGESAPVTSGTGPLYAHLLILGKVFKEEHPDLTDDISAEHTTVMVKEMVFDENGNFKVEFPEFTFTEKYLYSLVLLCENFSPTAYADMSTYREYHGGMFGISSPDEGMSYFYKFKTMENINSFIPTISPTEDTENIYGKGLNKAVVLPIVNVDHETGKTDGTGARVTFDTTRPKRKPQAYVLQVDGFWSSSRKPIHKEDTLSFAWEYSDDDGATWKDVKSSNLWGKVFNPFDDYEIVDYRNNLTGNTYNRKLQENFLISGPISSDIIDTIVTSNSTMLADGHKPEFNLEKFAGRTFSNIGYQDGKVLYVLVESVDGSYPNSVPTGFKYRYKVTNHSLPGNPVVYSDSIVLREHTGAKRITNNTYVDNTAPDNLEVRISPIGPVYTAMINDRIYIAAEVQVGNRIACFDAKLRIYEWELDSGTTNFWNSEIEHNLKPVAYTSFSENRSKDTNRVWVDFMKRDCPSTIVIYEVGSELPVPSFFYNRLLNNVLTINITTYHVPEENPTPSTVVDPDTLQKSFSDSVSNPFMIVPVAGEDYHTDSVDLYSKKQVGNLVPVLAVKYFLSSSGAKYQEDRRAIDNFVIQDYNRVNKDKFVQGDYFNYGRTSFTRLNKVDHPRFLATLEDYYLPYNINVNEQFR